MALPLPILIPQQRPGAKERGFVAAYAPSLEEEAGIDRMTFLHFIDDCNESLQGSKFLTGVEVVAFGVSFTPEAIAMGVATGVQLAVRAGNKANVRRKYVSLHQRDLLPWDWDMSPDTPAKASRPNGSPIPCPAESVLETCRQPSLR